MFASLQCLSNSCAGQQMKKHIAGRGPNPIYVLGKADQQAVDIFISTQLAEVDWDGVLCANIELHMGLL